MFDPTTDLLLAWASLGAMAGMAVMYANNLEGNVWIRNKLFRQNAKIHIKFVPGRFFKREVVVIKKAELLKGAEEIQIGEQPPVYKPVGSGAQYIFSRYGDANLLDPEKVEVGFYEPTEEAQNLIARAQKLNEDAKKLATEGKIEEANALVKNAQDEYNKAIAITPRWMRQQPPSSHFFGNLHRQILSRINAEVWAGLFGQLAKNAKMVLFAGVLLVILTAVNTLILFWKLVKI